MPITASEAAAVARRHGLSLADAFGLVGLATDVDDADRIAAKFAAPDTEAAARKLTAALFGHTPPAEPPEPADEGKAPSADIEARRFASRLFNQPD